MKNFRGYKQSKLPKSDETISQTDPGTSCGEYLRRYWHPVALTSEVSTTPEPKSKFWDTPNLIITPHVSSDDGENYIRLTLELFIKNLELFINNKPLVNQVDKKLGY